MNCKNIVPINFYLGLFVENGIEVLCRLQNTESSMTLQDSLGALTHNITFTLKSAFHS